MNQSCRVRFLFPRADQMHFLSHFPDERRANLPSSRHERSCPISARNSGSVSCSTCLKSANIPEFCGYPVLSPGRLPGFLIKSRQSRRPTTTNLGPESSPLKTAIFAAQRSIRTPTNPPLTTGPARQLHHPTEANAPGLSGCVPGTGFLIHEEILGRDRARLGARPSPAYHQQSGRPKRSHVLSNCERNRPQRGRPAAASPYPLKSPCPAPDQRLGLLLSLSARRQIELNPSRARTTPKGRQSFPSWQADRPEAGPKPSRRPPFRRGGERKTFFRQVSPVVSKPAISFSLVGDGSTSGPKYVKRRSSNVLPQERKSTNFFERKGPTARRICKAGPRGNPSRATRG